MHKQLQKQVKQLEREKGAPPLSYHRFVNDPKLKKQLGEFIYVSEVEQLEAFAAFLDACYPLESLIWLDSNVRPSGGGDEAAEDEAAGEQYE